MLFKKEEKKRRHTAIICLFIRNISRSSLEAHHHNNIPLSFLIFPPRKARNLLNPQGIIPSSRRMRPSVSPQQKVLCPAEFHRPRWTIFPGVTIRTLMQSPIHPLSKMYPHLYYLAQARFSDQRDLGLILLKKKKKKKCWNKETFLFWTLGKSKLLYRKESLRR